MVSELRKVRKGIDEGIYKAIRLVRIDGNENRTVLVPYSRATHTKELIPRFELIQNELRRNLQPGTYLIECKTGNSVTALVKSFKVVIPSALPEGTGSETHKKEEFINPEVMHDSIDMEEYKDLIKANATLKANEAVYLMKIEFLQSQLDNKTSLSDPAPTSSGVMKALEDNLPVAMSILDKFLEQRDRGLTLREKELENRISSNGNKLLKKKIKPAMKDNKKVIEKMQDLQDNDPEAFDATLDEMEEKDPELFDEVCEALGLFEEEEEEEEQE